MLKIRLQRVGRKHEPVFRLVLTDSQNSTKSGKYQEILGNFDSRHGEAAVFKADRITHWIGLGAQPSDTVHNLLVSRKIITGKKVNALPKKKPIVKEGAAESAEIKAEESSAEAPKEDVAEETPIETTDAAVEAAS